MRLRALPAVLPLLLLTSGLAGCGSGGDVYGAGGSTGPTFNSPNAEEPTAGSWRTWVIDASAPAFTPAAPPAWDSAQTTAELAELGTYAAARTPAQLSDVQTWDQGVCKRWNEQARQLVISTGMNPPRASRGYALLSVAMYDAMVAAFRCKYTHHRARPYQFAGAPVLAGVQPVTPGYVSERACLSAAAREVLAYLFPAQVGTVDALLTSALEADLVAGIAFRSDVETGRLVGRAVGLAVVAQAQTDGADNPDVATKLPDGTTYVPSVAAGTGHWSKTPPAFANPLLPGWGGVQPFVLGSGGEITLAAPPTFGSALWDYYRDEVHTVALEVASNASLQAIALFWADGAGTFTPPGHWNQIAVDLGAAEGLNECRMARMLALLNTAQADAFIACWWNKYHFDVPRPVTEIRANIDPAWSPLIGTPPFPAYPSGHSSTSGAASQVLAYLFPAHAAELAAMATEAKNSRLYGGIHYTFDNDAGLDLGRLIGNRVLTIAEHDGAN